MYWDIHLLYHLNSIQMSIRRLIDYLYYRCAKVYSYFGDPDPELMGRALASVPIGFNLLSIVYCLLYIFKVRVSKTQLKVLIICIGVISMFIIVRSIPFKEVQLQFKNEKNKTRNSILICIYYFLSIVLFFVCSSLIGLK